MKKISTILSVIMILTASTTFGQRYLSEVFSDVTVTSDVTYGVNATVIAYAQLGQAIPENLKMDIYQPAGDTETDRPLILYFHTGNFLPTPQNGSPSGTRQDLNVVEMCSRLARMGYVVASCDYRLGWNPVATDQETRVNTLINAAYRGVQDSRTAIRYFRMTEATQNDPYGIDPSRICVWGQGTGGYIAFATATLDQYADVLIPKFIGSSGQPMVIEFVNGNIDGTSVGVNPLNNDTLCYPNHVDYSSEFNVMVNMGGALGDSSWLDAGDLPMISFHAPTDPFAPYQIGTVIVPGFNLPVVEVSGSGHVQEMANNFNLNSSFQAADNLGDNYTLQANTYNNGNYGLYPLNRPTGSEADSAPWEWWNADNPNNANGLLTNPDMSMAKGMTYLDTIQAYVAPRLMCALNLPGNPCSGISGCTAMEACNYNPDATIEDFSCVFPGEPCDDLDASTINDVFGTDCVCAGMLVGCMEPTACNYNAAAVMDDGSCGFPGDPCEDGDPNTTGELFGSDCTCGGGLITGCTDMTACNYNPAAVTDDGSCLQVGDACDDGLATTENDVIDANCECHGTVGVLEVDQLFAVYPNPTDGLVIIGSNLGEAIQTITLFETSGRLIGTYSVNASQFVFDMSSLNDGIYLATIQTKANARMVRLEKR